MFGMKIEQKADLKLVRQLELLGDKVAVKVLRASAVAALRPVVKSAKAKAKAIKDSGLLAKSMGMRVKQYTKNGVVSGHVGPLEGKGANITLPSGKTVFRDPTKYIHLIELGHRIAVGGKLARVGKSAKANETGSVAGHVPANPILRRSLDENRSKMNSILRKKLAEGVIREAKKLRGK